MTNEEKQAKVRELLNAKYPVTIGTIAGALGCSMLEAAEELPAEMRSFAPGEDFERIWAALADWQSATVIIQYLGNVFEICCRLAPGKIGRGYYNIMGGKSPFEGHLKADAVKRIGFISLPFMGRESHFVAFFNEEGVSMYDVYVGRENHRLIESARQSFLALQKEYAR